MEINLMESSLTHQNNNKNKNYTRKETDKNWL